MGRFIWLLLLLVGSTTGSYRGYGHYGYGYPFPYYGLGYGRYGLGGIWTWLRPGRLRTRGATGSDTALDSPRYGAEEGRKLVAPREKLGMSSSQQGARRMRSFRQDPRGAPAEFFERPIHNVTAYEISVLYC
ncbi:hypothetical protein MTO96_019263 [Rhipicephalus appendiculatus]